MNRRHLLWSTVLVAAGTPLLSRADDKPAETPAPLPAAAPKPGLPTVMCVAPDAIVIVWGVDAPCAGFVEYGTTPQLGAIAYGSENGLRAFDDSAIAIRISGLKPGERLYYRTVTAPIDFPNHYKMKRGEGVASPVFDFVVPAAGPTAKIAVWNDTHQQQPTLVALGKATDAFAPHLLVLNGDLVADQFNKKTDPAHREEEDFIKTFFELGQGGEGWSRRPLAFVRGNHETRGNIARRLPKYAPRPGGDGYHGLLRVGPVAILQLDTGDGNEGPNIYGELGDFAAYREAQKAWLEKAITDPLFASAPYKILFCHIPLRWMKPERKGSWCADGDQRWSPLLAQAGVQAVISGHTHQFWHDAPSKDRPFHQIVSGGPQTKVSNWSKTPACLVTLDADASQLLIRVVEAESGTEHLKLSLPPLKM